MGHLKKNGHDGELELTRRAIVVGVITVLITGLLSGSLTAFVNHKLTMYRVDHVEETVEDNSDKILSLQLAGVEISTNIDYIKTGVDAIQTQIATYHNTPGAVSSYMPDQ